MYVAVRRALFLKRTERPSVSVQDVVGSPWDRSVWTNGRQIWSLSALTVYTSAALTARTLMNLNVFQCLKPGPYVKEMNDAATFYTNRVLKDYKET